MSDELTVNDLLNAKFDYKTCQDEYVIFCDGYVIFCNNFRVDPWQVVELLNKGQEMARNLVASNKAARELSKLVI